MDSAPEDIQRPFDEDKAVLEGQQMRMSEFPDAPEIDINADAPNVQVRRMIDEMIAAEQEDLSGVRKSA